MFAFAAPIAALALLGRQGTRAIAALVFVAIAVPPVDALLKPFVTEAIFVLLTTAFLRVDTAALRGYLGRPGMVLAATAWTTLAIPALFGLFCLASGLDRHSPDLFLGLMLQGVASPMMAAPALAALMGLDATLVLVTLIASTALTPLTAPLFAYLLIGPALTLSPPALGLKLFAILGGSALVAILIRRITGFAAVKRYKDELDGFNILVLFVFVAAVMENVVSRFFAVPLMMIGLATLAFMTFFAVLGVTALLFAGAGRERALALGLMASQRNMGLMLAVSGDGLPDLAWLYFALCQFPIYLSPHLLKKMARRLVGQGPARASRPAADASGGTRGTG
jgi:BASS family bile acid:Na+ symporter